MWIAFFAKTTQQIFSAENLQRIEKWDFVFEWFYGGLN